MKVEVNHMFQHFDMHENQDANNNNDYLNL